MNKPFFLIIAVFVFSSCNNEKKYSIQSNDKYEKSKESIEDIEKKNPSQFLSVSGNSKKNMVRQTVIRGKIFNKAKMVTFKDIEIKMKFYSKTGALLEEDIDVIYENIDPGGSASFKSKYFTPKGTDSVSMTVIGAKF